MRYTRQSRSGLLLLELVIVILFFALGSAVCIQVFARAHVTSQAARDLTFAAQEADSAAALLRGTGGSLAAFRETYPDALISDSDVSVYFDQDRQPCAPEDVSYTLTVRTEGSGPQQDASLAVTDRDGAVIYELAVRFPVLPAADGEEALP